MSFTLLDSLPFPRLPQTDARAARIVEIAARLTCAGPEMRAYWDFLARDGWVEAVKAPDPLPAYTNDESRFIARAELDAMVAHDLFGATRDELAYVLDAFPTVRERDEAKFGEFRTKRLILEVYDALAEAARTGQPYQSRLSPWPADPLRSHPARRAGTLGVAATARQPPETTRAVDRQEADISPTDRHVLVLCRVFDKHRGTRYERTLGSVKAEKVAHIVESQLGIDLGREPRRLAAGPADFPHLKKVVHRAEHGFFAFRTEERTGGQGATFVAMNGLPKALRSFGEVFGEQAVQLDRIIEIFLPMDSEQAEIVATLYAVWNDLLASGATPTDNDIIDGFLAWSPTKQRIARNRLVTALRWMREKELVPTGTGKRTEVGPQINA